jgi:hypothetical protein
VQLRTRRGSLVFTQSIELPGGVRSGRTLGLLGAGRAFPVSPRWNAHVLGIGGFDIANREQAIFPAFGIRAGAEWMRPSRTWNVLGASLTLARDLGGRRSQPVDAGTIWSLTFTVGNEAVVTRGVRRPAW